MEQFRFFMPARIVFGRERIQEAGNIVQKYGKKCMLISAANDETPLQSIYDKIKLILKEKGVDCIHFDEVRPNPSIRIVERAIQMLRQEQVDCILAIGGGSSIDTAKAVSLFHSVERIDWNSVYENYGNPFKRYPRLSKKKLPVIAIPTTAGTGSEVTQAMVVSEYETKLKSCIFHQDAFPDVAIIDPCLCLSMPKKLTAATGFDAFCHAFESYFRVETSALTISLGIRAMQDILYALPRLMQDLRDIELREQMSCAACCAGMSLANAGAHLPHPLSEIIGGIREDIPHGVALASVYPQFVAYCAEQEMNKSAQLVRALDKTAVGSDAELAARLPDIIQCFLDSIELNVSLQEFHVSEEDKSAMCNHFILNVLPFADYTVRRQIMESAFR